MAAWANTEVTSFQAYDYVEFDRQSSTTLAKHTREVEKAHIRDYPLAAQLNAAGRWKKNQSGRGFDWNVQYKRGTVRGNRMVETLHSSPKQRYKIAALPDRGFYADDAISELEVLQNRSPEGIIRIIDNLVENIREDLEQVIPHVYFYDGEATGYTEYWHGFESFFATNGTINSSTQAQRAANQADICGYPYDTYAGLSTELGGLGGSAHDTVSATNCWPYRNTDAEYEAWSPLVVIANSTHSNFSGASDNFATQGDEAIRFAIVHQGRFGRKVASTTGLMDRQLWFQLKNLLDDKERIQIQRGDKQSLVALGFTDVINFDGVELTWDNAVPSNCCYGYSYNALSGRSLYSNLIQSFGPRYDFMKQKHEAVCKVGGNLRFKSPRNFWKVVATHSQT